MSVKSHVQLPNGILKHFCYISGKVWYLDLKTGDIGLAGTKKLGTESGYFSDEMEQFLSGDIESPITNLCAKFRNYADDKTKEWEITKKDKDIIINFVKAAMARSQVAKQSFLSHSSMAQQCPDQANNDVLVYLSIQNSQRITELYNTFEIRLLVNETERKLVIPRNCFYTASLDNKEALVIPISPICAIIMFPPEYVSNTQQKTSNQCLYVRDPASVKALNKRALLYEYIYNQTFLASSDRGELEELQRILCEDRVVLDQEKNNIIAKNRR